MSAGTFKDKSFIQQLREKEMWVKRTGKEIDKPLTGAKKEVNRQIKQAIEGNPETGEGVTKSGPEN